MGKTTGRYVPHLTDSPATHVPKASPRHQAVDAFRGYAYQALAAALAWVELPEEARLYLEVAEDYAVGAGKRLETFQVKDTAASRPVTLHTKEVASVIDRFVTLIQENPSSNIYLHYLSTARIGNERPPIAVSPPRAGLKYWRLCGEGAPVEPLRHVLMQSRYSPIVHAFCEARDDDDLRRDLIQKVHWDCHQPRFCALLQDLEDRLTTIGNTRFGILPSDVPGLANDLFATVIKKSIHADPKQRILTRAELYRLMELSTHISIPRSRLQLSKELQIDTTPLLYASSTTTDKRQELGPTWIVHHEIPLAAGRVIERPALKNELEAALNTYGVCFLYGSSGVGKSTIARSVAAMASGKSCTVDFRNASGNDALSRLLMLFRQTSTFGPGTIVLEDLNVLHEPQMATHTARVLASMHRLDIRAVITCYRKPPTTRMRDMGLDPRSVVQCRYFSLEETSALVAEYKGEPSVWGKLAYTLGGRGHPQLVHAFISNVSREGWTALSGSKLDRIAESVPGDGIVDDARRRLVSELPREARAVLYRLSLSAVHFTRSTALAIAAPVPTSDPVGELLDHLIGPWIESVGSNLFRISPLASDFAKQMLTPGELTRIHESIATETLKGDTLVPSDLNALLFHCFAGKSADSLFRLAFSVFALDDRDVPRICPHFSTLRDWPADAPFPCTESRATAMLRLAQWRLLAATDEHCDLTGVVAAAVEATDQVQESQFRDALEAWILGRVLTQPDVANRVNNWVSLLIRASLALRKNELFGEFAKSVERNGTEEISVLTRLFAIGATGVRSVRRLESIVAALGDLEAAERNIFLAPRIADASYYSLVAAGPYTSEAANSTFDPGDAIARYERMAESTRQWALPAFTAHLWAARASLLDQYRQEKGRALSVLTTARRVVGSEMCLDRARGRIHFDHDEYARALTAFRRVMPELHRYTAFEREVVAREAAVSAARCGEWSEAEQWFDDAKSAAILGKDARSRIASAALEADAAGAALLGGNLARAIERFASAFERVLGENTEDSLDAAHSQRMIRHAIAWCYSTVARKEMLDTTGESVAFRPGACSNPIPNPKIREEPLVSADIVWYLLAQAEIWAGVGAGVESRLDDVLQDGRSAIWECILRREKMASSIKRKDALAVVRNMTPYLESCVYMDRNRSRLFRHSTENAPEPDALPKLRDIGASNQMVKECVENCEVAFALSGLFAGNCDALAELLQTAGEFENQDVAFWMPDAGSGQDSRCAEPLGRTVLNDIKRYGRTEDHGLEWFWGMSFTVFRWVDSSDFKDVLLEPLIRWLRRVWKDVLPTRHDQGQTLDATLQDVQKAIKSADENRSYVVDVLRSTLDAAVVRGRERYAKALEEI